MIQTNKTNYNSKLLYIIVSLYSTVHLIYKRKYTTILPKR